MATANLSNTTDTNADASDDSRFAITSGNFGVESAAKTLSNTPGDFASGNTLQPAIEARIASGTVNRSKTVTVRIYDQTSTLFASFTTSNLTQSDVVYTGTATDCSSYTQANLDAFTITWEVTEGGGMPDNLSVEVDHHYGVLDYDASVTHTGSGAINTTVPTLSGSGKVVQVIGSGAINTTVPTLSGTGTVIKTGTGAISTTVPTLSGTGEITKTGSGAINTTVPTLSGSGTVGGDITGSGAISTTVPTLSGSGTIIKTGSGAISTTVPTLSGAGVIIKTGTGAISTPLPTLAGAGVLGRSGSGAIQSPLPILSGSGSINGASPPVGGIIQRRRRRFS